MKVYWGVLLSLSVLIAGCSSKEEGSPGLRRAVTTEAMMAPPSATPDANALVSKPSYDVPPPPSAPAAPGVPAARLLIYHASVRVKAESLSRSSARLDSLVKRSGGYVSAATESREDGEWRTETTIRVPPSRFQPLLTGLSGLGTVEEKKLSTDDVTAEHADVAARLKTKRIVEARYVALLAKAQRIKDVLEIEEKIGEVREEIEATESRLKTLNDEVAYASITLNLYQPIAQSVPDAPVVSLGSRVVEAFYGGWQLLTSLLIGAVAIWPLWLLGAAAIWYWRFRKAKTAVPAAPVEKG